MNIQQQSYEVVARLASMEKMRQMQIDTNNLAAASRTLTQMADVFGSGPTAAELRNYIRNSMPQGNMTSGNDYWRATLSGLGATYDNGSNSAGSVDEMVRRAQTQGPLLEAVVPPDLSAYVRPGMAAAAYEYATRVQHKVGPALGAMMPLSVADTDRKIQEVNNRATFLDFVVRSPNLEVGQSLSGLGYQTRRAVPPLMVNGLGGLGAISTPDTEGYPESSREFWNDANARFWFGFFRHGGSSGVRTPEQAAAQIIANVGNICATDKGKCASIVEDTLDDVYGNPVEKYIDGGWEAIFSWWNGFGALTLLNPVAWFRAAKGPEIRIPNFDADNDVKYQKPVGGQAGGQWICENVYKGKANWVIGANPCVKQAAEANIAYLQRVYYLLGNLREYPGVAEGFNDFAWVGAEGAGNVAKFTPIPSTAGSTRPDNLPDYWASRGDAASGGDGGGSGAGAGGGAGTGAGAGGGDLPPPAATPTGIPGWVWIAGGGVLVVGIAALALMGGKKD